MPNSDQLLSHLSKRRRLASKAVTAIRETTNDQQMLWLASDALAHAEQDLILAIEFAQHTGTFSKSSPLAIGMKLEAIRIFKLYIALLHLIPIQLLGLPIFLAHQCLMFFGTWWLLFQAHISYVFVLPFVLANIVMFPLTCHLINNQVKHILDTALRLAEEAHEELLSHPLLISSQYLLEDNHNE